MKLHAHVKVILLLLTLLFASCGDKNGANNNLIIDSAKSKLVMKGVQNISTNDYETAMDAVPFTEPKAGQQWTSAIKTESFERGQACTVTVVSINTIIKVQPNGNDLVVLEDQKSFNSNCGMNIPPSKELIARDIFPKVMLRMSATPSLSASVAKKGTVTGKTHYYASADVNDFRFEMLMATEGAIAAGFVHTAFFDNKAKANKSGVTSEKEQRYDFKIVEVKNFDAYKTIQGHSLLTAPPTAPSWYVPVP
ncbi:MAG: hypothetical protein ISR65_18190 [Bacteriovoracaceae bacterium]|nr:hypothetical protein [Bacteriovoracaceae bacterium]